MYDIGKASHFGLTPLESWLALILTIRFGLLSLILISGCLSMIVRSAISVSVGFDHETTVVLELRGADSNDFLKVLKFTPIHVCILSIFLT